MAAALPGEGLSACEMSPFKRMSFFFFPYLHGFKIKPNIMKPSVKNHSVLFRTRAWRGEPISPHIGSFYAIFNNVRITFHRRRWRAAFVQTFLPTPGGPEGSPWSAWCWGLLPALRDTQPWWGPCRSGLGFEGQRCFSWPWLCPDP